MSKKFDKYYYGYWRRGRKYSVNKLEPRELRNIDISGSATVDGGLYNVINVSGSANISGDVEANLLTISGSCRVTGNIFAKKMSISGSASFNSIEADEVYVSGSIKVRGYLRVYRYLKMSGSISVTEDVVSKGKIKLYGSARISGLLSGDVILIITGNNTSEIGEGIRGKDIQVFYKRPYSESKLGKIVQKIFLLEFLYKMVPGKLYTKDIIAEDSVYLENTECEFVRGKLVKIGPRCEIKNVEYIDSINIDPSSYVNEVRKLNE